MASIAKAMDACMKRQIIYRDTRVKDYSFTLHDYISDFILYKYSTEMREKMTKFEFLGDLSRLIADLPEEDREQAMEYYEDYFADAGPDREQEIIKEFKSPAYIAEQLREAAAQRLAEAGGGSIIPSKAPEKPTVFSRKSAAQAVQTAQIQNNTAPVAEQQKAVQPTPVAEQPKVAQPTPAVSQPKMAQPTPATEQPKPVPAAEQPKAVQSAPTTEQQKAPQAAPVATAQPEQSTTDKEKQAYESLAMRNPIFQQRTAESTKKEEEELALRQKTKIDVKSINKNTAQISKKDRKAAKQRAAEEKAYNASLYSGPKKAMIALVLIIASPIILCVAGAILGLFAVAISLLIGLVALGAATLVASIGFLLLSLLALFSVKIGNAVFALGITLLLFAIGCGICFVDYKVFTRVIPSAYYSILAQVGNIKAKLNRLAMK